MQCGFGFTLNDNILNYNYINIKSTFGLFCSVFFEILICIMETSNKR